MQNDKRHDRQVSLPYFERHNKHSKRLLGSSTASTFGSRVPELDDYDPRYAAYLFLGELMGELGRDTLIEGMERWFSSRHRTGMGKAWDRHGRGIGSNGKASGRERNTRSPRVMGMGEHQSEMRGVSSASQCLSNNTSVRNNHDMRMYSDFVA